MVDRVRPSQSMAARGKPQTGCLKRVLPLALAVSGIPCGSCRAEIRLGGNGPIDLYGDLFAGDLHRARTTR